MAKQQRYQIKKDENSPEPEEVIASSVIEVANAFKKFKESKLEERAIVLLIQDICGQSIKSITSVLNAAASLSVYYIKKEKK